MDLYGPDFSDSGDPMIIFSDSRDPIRYNIFSGNNEGGTSFNCCRFTYFDTELLR